MIYLLIISDDVKEGSQDQEGTLRLQLQDQEHQRRLRVRAGAGLGGLRGGLPGAAPRDGVAAGGEDDFEGERDGQGDVRDGGAAAEEAGPPQHHKAVRDLRDGEDDLPGDGGVRGRGAVLPDRGEEVHHRGAHGHHHAADLLGHRLPAPPQHLPPRPQAREHPAQGEGQHPEHQADRLRHRQGLQGEGVREPAQGHHHVPGARGHQRQVRQGGRQLGLRGHPLHPPLRPPPLLRQGRHLHPHEHQEGHLHPRPRALPQVQQRGQGPHRQAAGEGPQQALHRPQGLRAPLGQAGNLQEHRGPQPPRGGLPRAQEARDHEGPQEDHPHVPGSADLREGDRGPAEDLREAGRQRQRHDLEGGDDDRARVPQEGSQRQPQRQRHRADLHRDGLRQQRTGGLHRVHRQLPRRHHHQERQVPAQGVREAGRGQGRQAQQARHREPHALRHRLPRQGRRPEDDRRGRPRRRRQDRLRRVPRAAQGEDQDLLQGDVVIPSLFAQPFYQPQ